MKTSQRVVAPYANMQSRASNHPPTERRLLEAVLLDDHDPVSELTVSVDTESSVSIRLYAHDLEAGGTARAQRVRFDDNSALVIADVPIVGYDLGTDALVTGTVGIVARWVNNERMADLVVEATALLEADCQSNPTHFTAVRRHPFNHDGISRLAAPVAVAVGT